MRIVKLTPNAIRLLKQARLGDKVEAVTLALGIKPCGGCKKRKALLNGELPQTDKKDK